AAHGVGCCPGAGGPSAKDGGVSMKRAIALFLAIGGLGTLLARCGLGSDHAHQVAVAALTTKPPPPPPPKPVPTVPCKHRYESLHPPATMPAPRAMQAGSFMARIEHRGHLIAGVDQNTLLFSYVDPLKGRFKGFEIDLLRQLSKAIFGNPNRV